MGLSGTSLGSETYMRNAQGVHESERPLLLGKAVNDKTVSSFQTIYFQTRTN